MPQVRRQTLRLIALVLIATLLLAGFLLRILGGAESPRLQPSSVPAYLPSNADSFDYYLDENRRRIRAALEQYYFLPGQLPFRGAYSLEQVAAMRAPFEFSPAPECDAPIRGILMVHGLTDSPYLLRNLGEVLSRTYPCALIRALLTPGHGTIPGDLLEASVEEWRHTFSYGVNSFADSTDELTVIGYSNGAALALDYLSETDNHPDIDKLIFISPGFRSTDTRAWLAPTLRLVWPWVYQRDDEDAVKYESFPMNAAAEFYNLTAAIELEQLPMIPIPTLMVVSGDDTTINADVTLELFCARLQTPQSHLIWYDSIAGTAGVTLPCEQIERRSPVFPAYRVLSYSHVALMIPPEDPHYGLDGNYPVCGAHGDTVVYERCMSDSEATVYAEASLASESGTVEDKLLRRTSFNPDFDQMIADISCFLDAKQPCSE